LAGDRPVEEERVDVLRRAAGAARPARWWDRGMLFCLLGVAVLGIAFGGWALADEVRGRPVTGTVLSCDVEPALYGRWLGTRTTCDVRTGSRTVTLETEGWHSAGETLSLRSVGTSVSDPALRRDEVWWLPGGVVAGAVAWWMGLPPRTDLNYGRHAAPRKGGRPPVAGKPRRDRPK
jgi:hypothetical protein